MKIDFDREIDRKSTWDLKWNGSMVADYLNTQVPEDFIPMWVADSDFACPPHVLQALRERLEKEVLGYCAPQKPFYDAVCWWQKERPKRGTASWYRRRSTIPSPPSCGGPAAGWSTIRFGRKTAVS